MSVNAVDQTTGNTTPLAGNTNNLVGNLSALTTNTKSDAVGAINEVNQTKQNATDNNLQTTDKTIVGGINELRSGLTNIGSNTDLGDVQGSDTITLSDAVSNYRFVQILIGYYASGYPCFGQALLPVSTLFTGSDDIPITVAFSDRTGTTSGKANISFLSATSAKVVNTSDAVYTKFFGIA